MSKKICDRYKKKSLLVAGAIFTLAFFLTSCGNDVKKKKSKRPAPVEVAAIESGSIYLFRTFNGSLEAQAEFMVAPKIGGRIKRLSVNLADQVSRGQVVAELDDEEYIQAVAQARADLEVARANLAEAESALKIAEREFKRVSTLQKRGIASESQFDAAIAGLSAKTAQLKVAKAQVTREEALLNTANVRLGYTQVTADWAGGDDQRLVAERLVDEGNTVSENTPLLFIVELNPIAGALFVGEKDYARLQVGQLARLTTDAYPDESFTGHIARISPVFREETRQARVELTIDNPDLRLKPGMFVRIQIELDRADEAIIVPDAALTSRRGQEGVFVVDEVNQTVLWRPVKVGIREGSRAQVEGKGISGRVISLGHQLVEDGSAILISQETQQ